MPKPGQTLDEQFEAIAEEAIIKAEGVKCSMDRFVEGLRDIEIAIRERRAMSEDEIRVRDKQQEESDE